MYYPAESAPTTTLVMPDTVSSSHDAYAAFRYRPFTHFAAGYTLAVISGAMFLTVANYDVHELTKNASGGGSAKYLTLLALVSALPVLTLSLFAGQLADRVSRKRVLMVTQVALVAMPLLYALLAWHGGHSVWSVLAIVLVYSCATTFSRPARIAMIPGLVSRESLGNAIAWNSSLQETSSMLGPAVAGMLIGHLNVPVTLLVASISMLGAFATTSLLPEPPKLPSEPATLKSLFAGVRFVFSTQLLSATMSLDLFAVLFGGATYLLPIFADRLGVGPTGYGLMRSAPAIGAIAMSVVLAHRKPFERTGRALLWAIVGFGLATIVFGLSRSFPLSLVALAALGAFDNISVVVRHSLVQLLTPESMRGRVGAVNWIFIGASNELGGVESGLTSALVGPVASVVGGGVLTIATVALVAWWFPDLRRLARMHELKPAEIPVEEPTLRATNDAAQTM